MSNIDLPPRSWHWSSTSGPTSWSGATPRGGRSAAEHLIAALRCLYRYADKDGLINEADNPALKVEKPRRLPSTRRAVTDNRLADINCGVTIKPQQRNVFATADGT